MAFGISLGGGSSSSSSGLQYGGELNPLLPARPADIVRFNFNNTPNIVAPAAGAKSGFTLGQWRNEVDTGDANMQMSFYTNLSSSTSGSPTSSRHALQAAPGGARGVRVGGNHLLARRQAGGGFLTPAGMPATLSLITQTVRAVIYYDDQQPTKSTWTGSNNYCFFWCLGGDNSNPSNVGCHTNVLRWEQHATYGSLLTYYHQYWTGAAKANQGIYFPGVRPTGFTVFHVSRLDNGDGTCRVQLFMNGRSLMDKAEYWSGTTADALVNFNEGVTGVNNPTPAGGGISLGQMENGGSLWTFDSEVYTIFSLAIGSEAMSAADVDTEYRSLLS